MSDKGCEDFCRYVNWSAEKSIDGEVCYCELINQYVKSKKSCQHFDIFTNNKALMDALTIDIDSPTPIPSPQNKVLSKLKKLFK